MYANYFPADKIKAPSTQPNSSSDSAISGITTTFSFSTIYQNYPSFKYSTQYQSSKYFPDNKIDLDGTKLMSCFDN